MEILNVESIRRLQTKITKDPIVYFWWFNDICIENLLFFLQNEIDLNRISKKTINGKVYNLLYVGKGKNGNERLIKYHILDSQDFHRTGIVNGRLSSLRQTLCGLLEYPMSTSKLLVNEFIDNNCIVEFQKCTLEELNDFENRMIVNNYLPLNHQNTKGILTEKHRKILTECKKRMKK